MRLDRLLTLALFAKLRPADSRSRGNFVPILMYHSISDELEEGVHPYYRVATHPKRFAQQMQWLADAGWKGVALEEALPSNGGNGNAGQRLVAITFDDGFRNFYTTAWGVLQHHGFTATMYLPTAFIASPRRSFLGKECLTWDEVRELRTQGIRFGSHTERHSKLYDLPRQEIVGELMQSKAQLERELAEEVTSFAYPYAFPQEDIAYTKAFLQLMGECGYRTCVTTVIGRARVEGSLLSLKRLPINTCDDRALLFQKLNGAYDWLGGVQCGFRRLNRWARRTSRGRLAAPLCSCRTIPSRVDSSI